MYVGHAEWLLCCSVLLNSRRTEKSAVRRRDGSLCTQKQPEMLLDLLNAMLSIGMLELCYHLLDGSVAEDMATASDGYKRVASAVEVSDRAHKPLGCLSVCGCGTISCLLVLQLCQVHSEDVPA